MAISAVSRAGADLISPFRLPEAASPRRSRGAEVLGPVREAAAIAGREDAEGPGKPGQSAIGAETGDDRAVLFGARQVASLDPRRPETLLGPPEPAEPEVRAAGRGGGAPERAGAAAAVRAEEAKQSDARRAEGAARKREAGSRLDDLMGQKAAMERRQAEQKGARSSEVLAMLSQLKARDGEVRAHEAAHIATGGRYITSGASYTYQRGPDGAQYAVGGEVGIDSSPAPGKPEETVQKMRVVRAAALAPSEPSSADLAVASAASQTEAAAIAEIAQRNAGEAARSYAREGARGAAGGRSGAGRDDRGFGLDMVA